MEDHRPDRPLTDTRWTEVVAPWLAWFGLRRVAAAAVSVVVVAGGAAWLLRSPAPATEAGLPFATAPPTGATVTAATVGEAPTDIVVHVVGAVERPGIVVVPAGSRVADAVAAAGGSRPDAEPDRLNLAAPVVDGSRISVPIAGEGPLSEEVLVEVPAAGPSEMGVGATTPIDVNRATAAELESLPGVGPATAEAIVAERERSGPFATVDDLDRVRGIGPAKLEALRGLVTT